jgi:T-complex protein 1 subunit theta
MGVGVIVCGEKISDIALHFMNKYHMVVIKLISKFVLRRLCRATKARPCVLINNVTPMI